MIPTLIGSGITVLISALILAWRMGGLSAVVNNLRQDVEDLAKEVHEHARDHEMSGHRWWR